MVDEKRGKINKTLRLLNAQLETVENETDQDFVNESVLNAAKTIAVKICFSVYFDFFNFLIKMKDFQYYSN